MPAVSQPGSRGALVTWIVILAILFVTATIFAFIFQAEARQATLEKDTSLGKYADYISPTDLAGNEDIDAIKAERADARLGTSDKTPVINAAIQQRKELTKVIGGSPTDPALSVVSNAQAAIGAAARIKASGVTEVLPTDNLIAAVGALTAMVEGRQSQIAQLTRDLLASKEQIEAAIKNSETQAAAHNAAMEAVREETTNAIKAAQEAATNATESVTAVDESVAAERGKTAETLNTQIVKIQELSNTVAAKDQVIKILQQKLGELRVPTKNSAIRQADGSIVRIPAGNVVYVDLGAGDQVTPGLTFEVFDKNDGIPGLPAKDGDETTMPAGKAEIEITRVGATSSEARIVKVRPGQQLTEGDVIMNLVYDKNTKYNFVVWGNFDLDQNGVATAHAEVIKRLITQWGGKVTNDVSVDTDFLVMGKEPEIPTYTDEELQDAENLAKRNQATEASDAYAATRSKAIELYIPILNQNRFLYFVGYYDSAKR